MTPSAPLLRLTLFALGAAVLAPRPASAADCPPGASAKRYKQGDRIIELCLGTNLFGDQNKVGPLRVLVDGRLYVSGEYVDGRRDGTWTSYDEQGRVSAEWSYRLGRLMSSSAPELSEQAIFYGRGRPATAARFASTTATPNDESAASTPDLDPVSTSDPIESAWHEESPRNQSSVSGYAEVDAMISVLQGVNVYGLGLGAGVGFDRVAFEADWDLGFAALPGEGSGATPLNPTFTFLYRARPESFDLRFGLGVSLPVRGAPQDFGDIIPIATAGMVTSGRGLWDFWTALPSAVTVVLPSRLDAQIGRGGIDADLDLYVPISTEGGSSDLGMQLAFGGYYSIVDPLRIGARSQLVLAGVTNPNPAISVEPYVEVLGGPVVARAGFLFSPLMPSEIQGADGIVWSTNLTVGLRFD